MADRTKGKSDEAKEDTAKGKMLSIQNTTDTEHFYCRSNTCFLGVTQEMHLFRPN